LLFLNWPVKYSHLKNSLNSMKLLLDENLPRKLKRELSQHDAYTAAEMGWNGKANGELLAVMLEENFQALLTADKNLQHQQNFQTYPIPVIVLNARFITFDDLQPLMSKVNELLEGELQDGPTIVNE
jgi:predicted nuclease of predicted toxin-antitoxin system